MISSKPLFSSRAKSVAFSGRYPSVSFNLDTYST
ncbi:hypothetical protein SAMN05216605_101151 [Pseudomonas abietaniphila]|uniref:Uncharacterized protein n=1 Tax=Pseudomonas abietaniphila TaxID=89065 RepID=A0A1G7RI91_9PSED|nr:hypothetical protein SAMN05216605_101151 [Pseudomonas abietaniphila]